MGRRAAPRSPRRTDRLAEAALPTWLYDDVGCALFERITRLPEYYPTRRERSILRRHAAEIAGLSGADTLVEIGSGASDKSRLLLDTLRPTGHLARFVPFDIALPTLTGAARSVASAYAGVTVHAVAGDFRRHVGAIPAGGRRTVRLPRWHDRQPRPRGADEFPRDLAAAMAPGDTFLVGTDLVKDRGRLVAAYDDAAGVTAAFDKNVLVVLNRELGADFDLDALRPRRPLRRGSRVDRDAPARPVGTDRHGARTRARRRVRGRRGPHHGGQHQVPDRRIAHRTRLGRPRTRHHLDRPRRRLRAHARVRR